MEKASISKKDTGANKYKQEQTRPLVYPLNLSTENADLNIESQMKSKSYVYSNAQTPEAHIPMKSVSHGYNMCVIVVRRCD